MFAKKHPVFFLSERFIETGIIVLSREPFFESGEAVSYTSNNLKATLESLEILKGKTVRIVLSETLVYVTGLFFPQGTKLTRDLVQAKAEEAIPEDLRATKWDFRTMQYFQKEGKENEIAVQVAVVEQSFVASLETILESSVFSIATILPESYTLASLASAEEGLTVIVAQDRENVLLVACEGGFVLGTEVQKNTPSTASLLSFIAFAENKAAQKISQVYVSHTDTTLFDEVLKQVECPVERRDYNPLLATVLERLSGSDADVLNLNVLAQSAPPRFFGMFRKKAS